MATDLAGQLAERIRGLREQHGLSIRGLARLAGLPPELISRSERGATVATVPSILKICEALKLELPQFFDFDAASASPLVETGRKNPRASERLVARDSGKPTLHPELMEMVQWLSQRPQQTQRRVARGVRQLLDAGAVPPQAAASRTRKTSKR